MILPHDITLPVWGGKNPPVLPGVWIQQLFFSFCHAVCLCHNMSQCCWDFPAWTRLLTPLLSLCCSHLQHRVSEADVGTEQLRLLPRLQRRAHHSRAHPELVQQGVLLPEQLRLYLWPPPPSARWRNNQIDRQTDRDNGETGSETYTGFDLLSGGEMEGGGSKGGTVKKLRQDVWGRISFSGIKQVRCFLNRSSRSDISRSDSVEH